MLQQTALTSIRKEVSVSIIPILSAMNISSLLWRIPAPVSLFVIKEFFEKKSAGIAVHRLSRQPGSRIAFCLRISNARSPRSRRTHKTMVYHTMNGGNCFIVQTEFELARFG